MRYTVLLLLTFVFLTAFSVRADIYDGMAERYKADKLETISQGEQAAATNRAIIYAVAIIVAGGAIGYGTYRGLQSKKQSSQ